MDQEEQQFYMEQLMDNYKNPQNKSVMKDYTFFKKQKNASCGDMFEIYVKIDKNESKIVDVKYEGEGCAISTASFSLFSQKLIGMDFEKAKKLKDKDIYEMLGVTISAGRVNCAMLSLNAFLNGVKDFESKD